MSERVDRFFEVPNMKLCKNTPIEVQLCHADRLVGLTDMTKLIIAFGKCYVVCSKVCSFQNSKNGIIQ